MTTRTEISGTSCYLEEDDVYIIAYDRSNFGTLAKYNKRDDMTESISGFGSKKGNRLMCYVYPFPHIS